jgi:hypothetical protein
MGDYFCTVDSSAGLGLTHVGCVVEHCVVVGETGSGDGVLLMTKDEVRSQCCV